MSMNEMETRAEQGIMTCPEEREQIVKSIMRHLESHETVSYSDIVTRNGYELHYSWDKKLVLQELADSGHLVLVSGESEKDKVYKGVKQNMESKTVYKALLKEEDGTLASTIAGRGISGLVAQNKPTLTYAVDEITASPVGSDFGIFVEPTIEKAISHARARGGISGNTYYAGRQFAIHEAETIGIMIPCFSLGSDTYPAILLGKQVAIYPEPVPEKPFEPKFKVGDRIVLITGLDRSGPCGGCTPVDIGVVAGYSPRTDGNFTIDFPAYGEWNEQEDRFELAPPEEVYEDVTDECKVSLQTMSSGMKGQPLDSWLCIIHDGKHLFLFGTDGVTRWNQADGYYLATAESDVHSLGSFRVIKKVS